jgi:hypothetical protein
MFRMLKKNEQGRGMKKIQRWSAIASKFFVQVDFVKASKQFIAYIVFGFYESIA